MNEPMIRIRTKVGQGRVFTLFFREEWVTIMSGIGKSESVGAKSLLEASENHLAYCRKLKELSNDYRGRVPSQLLRGEGHQGNVSDGVSACNVGSNREGPDGRDRDEREEVLPPDTSSHEDKESLPIGPQKPELES